MNDTGTALPLAPQTTRMRKDDEMDKRQLVLYVVAAGMLVGIPGCDRGSKSGSDTRGDARGKSGAAVAQTGFPGQVTAGGGTSGEVLGRVGQTKDGSYAGGTPGIAGGSGGNTGGAATGGSVQETGRGPSQGVTPPSGQTPANRP